MRLLRTILATLIVLVSAISCKKDPPKLISSGSFSYNDVQYNISMLRVEHKDYTADSAYVLRLTVYPSTYKISETTSSGFGTVIDLYFIANNNDFARGVYPLASIDTLPSMLYFYPEIIDKNAQYDTTSVWVSSGTLIVDTFPELEFMSYTLEFVTASGDSIVGKYRGKHIHNYSVDQKGYGSLQVDTIECSLSHPSIIHWGKLFGDVNYSEIVFYNTSARFTDAGKMRDGVQLVIGLTTTTDDDKTYIESGIYPITTDYSTPHTALYGHKLKSTPWGTYWQQMYKSSVTGKANVLEGEVEIEYISDNEISLTISATDQLKNNINATYSGAYKE